LPSSFLRGFTRILGPAISFQLCRRSMVMSETPFLPSSFLKHSHIAWVQQFASNFVDVRRLWLKTSLPSSFVKEITQSLVQEFALISIDVRWPCLKTSLYQNLCPYYFWKDSLSSWSKICSEICRRSTTMVKTSTALTLNLLLEKFTHFMVQQTGFSFVDVR